MWEGCGIQQCVRQQLQLSFALSVSSLLWPRYAVSVSSFTSVFHAWLGISDCHCSIQIRFSADRRGWLSHVHARTTRSVGEYSADVRTFPLAKREARRAAENSLSRQAIIFLGWRDHARVYLRAAHRDRIVYTLAELIATASAPRFSMKWKSELAITMRTMRRLQNEFFHGSDILTRRNLSTDKCALLRDAESYKKPI